MKVFFSLLIVQLSILVLPAQDLRQQLWNSVKDCDEAIKFAFPEEDIEKNNPDIYERLEEHISNGYLSIKGSWSTCGCSCEATVAAYRDAQKNYTLLRDEYWDCDDEFGIYASRPLKDVLPLGFGLETFMESSATADLDGNAYFYLKADIPLKGTETVVHLKLFRLGRYTKSSNGIAYNTEQTKRQMYNVCYSIRAVIDQLEGEKELQRLLNQEYNQLSSAALQTLSTEIGAGKTFQSKADFHKMLRFLQGYHKAYQQLKYNELSLKWNREKARFEVGEKRGNWEKMTFYKFLNTMSC